MYKRILVAIDDSQAARLGLSDAIGLAQALHGQLRLIHIVNTVPSIAAHTDAALAQKLVDQLRSTGESIVHEATHAVRAAGVEVDSRIIEAFGEGVGECMVKEAITWPAQLIVCGTHGRTGIRRWLMGSNAEYIVRHSPTPVLLVRAPDAAA